MAQCNRKLLILSVLLLGITSFLSAQESIIFFQRFHMGEMPELKNADGIVFDNRDGEKFEINFDDFQNLRGYSVFALKTEKQGEFRVNVRSGNNITPLKDRGQIKFVTIKPNMVYNMTFSFGRGPWLSELDRISVPENESILYVVGMNTLYINGERYRVEARSKTLTDQYAVLTIPNGDILLEANGGSYGPYGDKDDWGELVATNIQNRDGTFCFLDLTILKNSKWSPELYQSIPFQQQ